MEKLFRVVGIDQEKPGFEELCQATLEEFLYKMRICLVKLMRLPPLTLTRRRATCCVVLIAAPLLTGQDGAALYKEHCAVCHDRVSPRTPSRSTLNKMPVSGILRAMDFGSMMSVAQPLRRNEREAIANFLGTPGKTASLPASAFCSEKVPPLSDETSLGWMGWSPAFTNTRFQPAEAAGLTPAQTPRPSA